MPFKDKRVLAFGIPTIIAYCDTDFPDEKPFLLQLPNSEENIANNTNLIRRFVEQWKGKRIDRKEIIHLDVYYKARRQINFFTDVLMQ